MTLPEMTISEDRMFIVEKQLGFVVVPGDSEGYSVVRRRYDEKEKKYKEVTRRPATLSEIQMFELLCTPEKDWPKL